MAPIRWTAQVLAIMCIGCSPQVQSVQRQPLEVIPITREITTPAELTIAAASRRAVIHMDVDWSVTAIHSRPVVAQFRNAAADDETMTDVAFYRIDCTDNTAACSAFDDWLDEQRPERVRFGGNGALVWVLNGRWVDSIENAGEHQVSDLMRRTKENLRTQPGNG